MRPPTKEYSENTSAPGIKNEEGMEDKVQFLPLESKAKIQRK